MRISEGLRWGMLPIEVFLLRQTEKFVKGAGHAKIIPNKNSPVQKNGNLIYSAVVPL